MSSTDDYIHVQISKYNKFKKHLKTQFRHKTEKSIFTHCIENPVNNRHLCFVVIKAKKKIKFTLDPLNKSTFTPFKAIFYQNKDFSLQLINEVIKYAVQHLVNQNF